jgi:transposase InsO family protein
MPWLETDAMKERSRFVLDYESGLFSMSELCERYGISRPTGYKWWARYEAQGLQALQDRSRRPQSCPHRTDARTEQALVTLRREHPTWGPVTLLDRLKMTQPELELPAVSTAAEILDRHGLIVARKRRSKPHHPGRPYLEMRAPNDVWSADFKGEFLTRDHRYCYPLTIADGCSRYLLVCRGQFSTAYLSARTTFRAAFREFGLPLQILTDNGGPFASCAIAGLSRLSAWWIKLGIHPIRIEPGKPAQNGRHERMHRTLKADTTRPPASNLAAQQRRFERFRRCYNEERPHQGLEGQVPAALYHPSSRTFPEREPELSYPGHFKVLKVCANGCLKWHNRYIFVSTVLSGEILGLEPFDDGIWSVHFGSVLLGRIDERDHKFWAL